MFTVNIIYFNVYFLSCIFQTFNTILYLFTWFSLILIVLIIQYSYYSTYVEHMIISLTFFRLTWNLLWKWMMLHPANLSWFCYFRISWVVLKTIIFQIEKIDKIIKYVGSNVKWKSYRVFWKKRIKNKPN